MGDGELAARMLQALRRLADAIDKAAQRTYDVHRKFPHTIRESIEQTTRKEVEAASTIGPAARTDRHELLVGGGDHVRTAPPLQRPTSPAVKGPIGHMSAEEVEALLVTLGPPAEWPERVRARMRVFEEFAEETTGPSRGGDWLSALRACREGGSPGSDLVIDFYHATHAGAERFIRAGGVDTRYPRYFCDVGQGFYTGDNLLLAEKLGSRHSDPVVLHYRIKLEDLKNLEVKIFEPGSPELEGFLLRGMFNDPETPYDVVIAPFLVNREAFAFQNAAPIYAGRQIVFCNDTGRLLDAGLQPASTGLAARAESALSEPSPEALGTGAPRPPGAPSASSAGDLFGEGGSSADSAS
ncbi:hypothetical protein [Nocardia panacis]|uniref:hypothetical protein n=1 Tax=Nocardia panacis TaxID=2340916 RepID=UPI0013153778|nr:hypothetical protein [Nocardia panacis]